MTTLRETNLKKLFQLLQPGSVVTADWLETYGISRNLQQYYLKSGWLESIGRSAYKKPGDTITWQGALEAIQKQTDSKVHLGGLSALELHGLSHYFRLRNESLQLFSPLKTKLPKWFVDYDWQLDIQHHMTSFLPLDLGIKKMNQGNMQINVSTPERAIMECLYLAPQKMDLIECYHIFEGLVNLKPKLVDELLSQCNSVKVKRLFLYMAEKANHQWLQFVKTQKLDLGTGNRMLAEKGVHIPKYLLSIPKELAQL